MVFPQEEGGDRRIQQKIQVSDLQDQREEGSAVHHRTFHKLCAGSSSQHRQTSPALDKERSGTTVSTGLLEKLICVIETLVMVALFSSHVKLNSQKRETSVRREILDNDYVCVCLLNIF